MNKLLINLSMLGPRPTGLGVYAVRCGRVAAQAFDAELIAADGYGGPGRIALRSPEAIALGASRWAGAKRWWWARGTRQPAGTLLYSPTHQGLASAAAQVLTIHDLTSVRHPATHPIQGLYFRHVLPAQLKRCAAVFTVSQTTRQDLHEFYRLPLESIHVVPNGVDGAVFKPADLPRSDFLLVVGATFSHKNIDELIRFSALWRRDYSLVIVSSRGAYRQVLERAVADAGLVGRVRFIDYASTEELVRLYQTCSAFVFPSKWEGFGIPPLEALACGAKVIVSDIPVHREVLGDAVSYVTLGDEASWAAALAGIARAAAPPDGVADPVRKYSWDSSARALVAALSAVAPSLRRAAAPLPSRAAA
jgi:glycosyltransferase involved in cell wall biosynthesis